MSQGVFGGSSDGQGLRVLVSGPNRIHHDVQLLGGMTLRDWFAGQALAGLLADSNLVESPTSTAEACYHYADAMLKARGGAA